MKRKKNYEIFGRGRRSFNIIGQFHYNLFNGAKQLAFSFLNLSLDW